MFNPWTNLNPNQQFPFWGQPASLPGFTPPLFNQLFDLSNVMRTIQQAAPNQTADTAQMRQLEEIIRSFSAVPLFAGLPGASVPQQNPWTSFFNIGNSGAMTPTWNPQNANAPALGIGREFQEDWTKMMALRLKYDNATQEFRGLFDDFVRKASENFVSSLSDVKDQQDFRSLCRKWIDCCEDEFQLIAKTPEYSTRLGKMINTHLRLMQHSNEMQEKLAALHGYPSRGELDNLHQKNVQTQAKIEELENKIHQLESKLKPKTKSAPRRKRSPK